ncbi:hypothetical protein CVT26_002536 [Gymnopilus dilepis]|uniref:Uncharacterized protein n=1 Tax=Gymnopilus dilepis TaxID=231916 RepID=A0A409VSW2_9AGAR|nr:hypothetical protein CVT26_002536 [Gymnopilus dilepis]
MSVILLARHGYHPPRPYKPHLDARFSLQPSSIPSSIPGHDDCFFASLHAPSLTLLSFTVPQCASAPSAPYPAVSAVQPFVILTIPDASRPM